MSNIPTLALIPSAYNTSKVYSILPSNGDGDFTFSRTGEATRVNQAGVIETVASDVPRIDYSDSNCPSLLLEPQRTNTFLNSEPTSNENAGSGITYESYFWENGLQNSIVFGDNSVIRFRYGGTGTLNEYNTLSFYIKMDDLGEPFPSLSVSGSDKDFTFVIGGDVLANSFSKKYVGNNIWRIQATRNTTASWSNSLFNGILKSTGHSNRGFKATGFQLEVGSYATSYIPTSGGTSTRNQDVCNSSGNATLFNDDEGVLFVETKGFEDVPKTNGYIQLSKNGESSFTNSLVIQHRNNGALRIYVDGTASTDLHFNINIDFTQNHKIAILYKLNGYKLFIDGVAQSLNGTPTQAVFSGLDDLSFDLRGSTGWNAKIKDLRYYNTELTDAELIELTTL